MGSKVRYIPDNHKPEDESHIISFIGSELQGVFEDRQSEEKNIGRFGIQMSDLHTKKEKEEFKKQALYFDKVNKKIFDDRIVM